MKLDIIEDSYDGFEDRTVTFRDYGGRLIRAKMERRWHGKSKDHRFVCIRAEDVSPREHKGAA